MRITIHSIMCLTVLVLFVSCSKPGKNIHQAGRDGEVTNLVDVSSLTEEMPKIKGPKRTVAVGKFTSLGSFDTKYGSWDVGGGLGAMLTTSLNESGRFIVLERTNVKRILSEQEMAGDNVTTGTTKPELGKMTGVQYMIFGAVTEFGDDDKGGGFSLGLGAGFGGMDDLVSGGASRKTASGSVAIDIRVVDTTSGRIIETIRVKEPIDSSAWDFSVGYEEVTIGSKQFNKTPIGAASRKAIAKIVSHLALTTSKQPWTGMIVDFEGETTIINAGSSSGIKIGDLFMAEGVTKKFTDPATGEVLSVRKKQLGTIEITEVEEKIAIGLFLPLSMEIPKRGDLVVELTEK